MGPEIVVFVARILASQEQNGVKLPRARAIAKAAAHYRIKFSVFNTRFYQACQTQEARERLRSEVPEMEEKIFRKVSVLNSEDK